MLTKYVAKAMTPTGEDTCEGEYGPFYRYFKADSLEGAAETTFQNRHAWFAGGRGAGGFGGIIGALGLESVTALAVKEVGRKHRWQVILDTEGLFLQKKSHTKYELESVARKYDERAFKDRTEYVFEMLGIKRNPTT